MRAKGTNPNTKLVTETKNPFRVFHKKMLVSKHATQEQATQAAKTFAKAFKRPYKVLFLEGWKYTELDVIQP